MMRTTLLVAVALPLAFGLAGCKPSPDVPEILLKDYDLAWLKENRAKAPVILEECNRLREAGFKYSELPPQAEKNCSSIKSDMETMERHDAVQDMKQGWASQLRG